MVWIDLQTPSVFYIFQFFLWKKEQQMFKGSFSIYFYTWPTGLTCLIEVSIELSPIVRLALDWNWLFTQEVLHGFLDLNVSIAVENVEPVPYFPTGIGKTKQDGKRQQFTGSHFPWKSSRQLDRLDQSCCFGILSRLYHKWFRIENIDSEYYYCAAGAVLFNTDGRRVYFVLDGKEKLIEKE